jgi:RNA polymerase sigma-70 factor (ECF subfamily)
MADIESELVIRAAEGDYAAIQRLLTRHHERLEGLIAGKVPADLQAVLSAEDVCQEAYVAVFQQISSLRDRTAAGFGGWLRAIAERKLIDSIRALRTQKRGGGRQAMPRGPDADVSSVIDLLDVVAQHEHTPSRSVRRRELVSQMRGAMDGLKPEYREVLHLHYIEGMTVAETAQRMRRSPGSVLMLCNRALRKLAEIIGDPGQMLSQEP